MKICIVRLSALGDVVMTLPLIRTLQKEFPEAHLSWVVSESISPILKYVEGVDLIPVKKMKSLADFIAMRRLFQKKTFDVLIGAQASLSANLFYPLISAKRKIGFDRKRSNDCHGLFVRERVEAKKEHILDSFLGFARHLGIQEFSLDGRIPLSNEDRDVVKRIPGPYYVIHPCSSEKERDWPLERYIEVGRFMKESHPHLSLVITGSKDDQRTAHAMEEGVGLGSYNLAGKLSLRELAAILESAAFLLAPDTGPVHIASSFHTKVIGLYAANSPTLSGPYNSQEYVIDKYEEALFRYSKTKYPKPDRYIRVHHDDIMKLISVQEVFDKIQQFF